MVRLTDKDFDKVQSLIEQINKPTPPQGEDSFKRDQANAEAFYRAIPIVLTLIKYFCDVLLPIKDPTADKAAVLNGMHEWTQKGYRGFRGFLEHYPTELEEAIAAYKSDPQIDLAEALEQTVSSMTGKQFLSILLEYNRLSQKTKSDL